MNFIFLLLVPLFRFGSVPACGQLKIININSCNYCDLLMYNFVFNVCSLVQ